MSVEKKIKPMEDRILVKRLDSESKSAGGIIIPDTAKEKPLEGMIVAVGDGKRSEQGSLIPMSLKVGDKVLFAKWSGTEIKHEGEDLLIMKEADVLAILS